MISNFLKIKVMGVILMMCCAIYGIGYVADQLYFKPVRERALPAAMGKEFHECLASQLVRQEALERKMTEGATGFEDIGRDVQKAKIFVALIYLGLLYLFSGMLVRVVRQEMAKAQPANPADA